MFDHLDHQKTSKDILSFLLEISKKKKKFFLLKSQALDILFHPSIVILKHANNK